MRKKHYNFSHLQPEQVGSSEQIDIEDSYSVDEELIFGTGEQAEQTKQVDYSEHAEQVKNIQMTRNEIELNKELRETLRAIRDGRITQLILFSNLQLIYNNQSLSIGEF